MASSDFNIGNGPVEEKHAAHMRAMGAALHEFLNGVDVPIEQAKTAFVLMVFDIGEGPGRCNYIATCRREDVITLLKEQLALFQGMPYQEGRA